MPFYKKTPIHHVCSFLGLLGTRRKLKPKFPNQFLYQNIKDSRYDDHVSESALDFTIKSYFTFGVKKRKEI